MSKRGFKIIKYFKDQVELLGELLGEVYRHPSEEKVHKLRVTIRRIRSVLLISDNDLKPLKKLAKTLGEIRDLDVAIMNTKKYQLDAKKLQKKRMKIAKGNNELLTKNKRQKINKDLEEVSFELEKKPNINMRPSMDKLKKELIRWKGKIKDEDLHGLRIILKKVRYLFEAQGRAVAYLKKVQDQLGLVHDLEVLEEYYINNERIIEDKHKKRIAARKVTAPVLKRVLRELK